MGAAEGRGKMVCVVGTLFHDVHVGGNDAREVYLSNVRWYVGLMQGGCSHIVWMGAPARVSVVGVPQSLDLLRSWNSGVEQLLRDEY